MVHKWCLLTLLGGILHLSIPTQIVSAKVANKHAHSINTRASYRCCEGFIRTRCGCAKNELQCHDLSPILALRSDYYCKSVQIVHQNATITKDLFKHLKTDQLVLSNNNVENIRISNDALDGLANTLQTLVLSNNSLTALPKGIANLTQLQHLDVSDNPIVPAGLNNEVLKSIGDKLRSFKFGSHAMNRWPTTLTHLQSLQILNVTKATFSLMPEDAFHGFEGTLLHLTIMNTKLNSVPLAISRLTFLQSLHFDYNHYVGNSGMNIPKVENLMPFLTNVSIAGDNITTFPQALGSFSKLLNIILDKNNIEFVSDESAGAVSNVTRLSLRNSGLIRIPGALRNILGLTYLDLSENNIHNVDYRDIRFLRRLKTFKMNDNPIIYISKYAFIYNHEIDTLELRNTNLTRVPCAIVDLFKMQSKNMTLDLSNTKVECNCDLRWLYEEKLQSNTNMVIKGECDTIYMSVQEYIDNELPFCPESSSTECRDRT